LRPPSGIPTGCNWARWRATIARGQGAAKGRDGGLRLRRHALCRDDARTGLRLSPADIDEDAVAKGKLAISPDGRVPLPDHCADVVLSAQVLEHVADLDAYCAEIRRLLKPGGTLLLSTHGSWFYHPIPQDHRRWTRTGLALDLETRGLKVEETISICGPLATTTMIRLTAFAFVLKKLPVLGPLVAGALAMVMNSARCWKMPSPRARCATTTPASIWCAPGSPSPRMLPAPPVSPMALWPPPALGCTMR
jgi:SAM-dependent methyltransferase